MIYTFKDLCEALKIKNAVVDPSMYFPSEDHSIISNVQNLNIVLSIPQFNVLKIINIKERPYA